MSTFATHWVGNYGVYQIEGEFAKAPVAKDGWPDQRYTLGKAMVAHYEALDRATGRLAMMGTSIANKSSRATLKDRICCSFCGHKHFFTADTPVDFECQDCGRQLTRKVKRQKNLAW